MKISIRKAQPEDAELLHRLAFSIYPVHFRDMWLSECEMYTYLEREFSLSALDCGLQNIDVCWLIAETDRPVGFAKLTWTSTIPNTAISGVSLDRIYFNPEDTGKHFGKLMFREIITASHEEGKKFLWLTVREPNGRARKFYEELGMQHLGNTVFRTETQLSTLHIMGMEI